MSSINCSSISVPTETSERKSDEYKISEQTLLQRLTEVIGKKNGEGAYKTESTSFTCIYRVPEELRKLKESAYSPRVLSIGPFHSNEKHILKSPVQNIKMIYVNSLLSRITGESEERKTAVLKECLCKMRESIEDAKKCYAEDVEKELNEEMLVIDGCFILELLYKDYLISNGKNNSDADNASNQSSDPIFDSNLMAIYVRHDLLLLENQLPFFVLNKLFGLTVAHIADSSPPSPSPPPNLSGYVISYFGNMMNLESNGTRTSKMTSGEIKYHHILHIVHHHYNPGDRVEPKHVVPSNSLMPCASELEYAGVKFESRNSGTGEELKVKFSEPKVPSWLCRRAHFEIPTLCLYDSTEPFLRNLIAFEQCCPGVNCYFTSYAVLMDTLINTPKDVQVLQKAGIIRNYLGADEDCVDLFNNLCKEVVSGESYLDETTNGAAEYSKRRWPHLRAQLQRKFASPWTTAAFIVGFVTFFISFINFIISMIKFFHGN